MKRWWRIEAVFVRCRPLVCRSRRHLRIVEGDECRREVGGRWKVRRSGARLLIAGTAQKSIWCSSIKHLIMQMMVIRRIYLFTERSFFGHYFFRFLVLFTLFFCAAAYHQESNYFFFLFFNLFSSPLSHFIYILRNWTDFFFFLFFLQLVTRTHNKQEIQKKIHVLNISQTELFLNIQKIIYFYFRSLSRSLALSGESEKNLQN